MIEKIKNHVELAQNRLLPQDQEFIFKAWIKSLVSPTQKIENTLYFLLKNSSLYKAEGALLDALGSWHEPRLGRGDEEYRLAIFIRIAINLSHGTPDSILRITRSILNPAYLRYSDNYPAGFTLSIQTEKDIDFLKPLINTISPVGVDCNVFYTPSKPFMLAPLRQVNQYYTTSSINYEPLMLSFDDGEIEPLIIIDQEEQDISDIAGTFAFLVLTPQYLSINDNNNDILLITTDDGEIEPLRLRTDDEYEYCEIIPHANSGVLSNII